ncbi:Zinc metalloprotease [Vibrio chagasii]|nr:Zinc metalloprotease [Vibrio chagasii]
MDFITNGLTSIISVIILLGVLIGFHEFGHYIVARALGIKVEYFSIGFGKVIYSRKSMRSGITYQIAALPLGGYVAFADKDESHLTNGKYLLKGAAKWRTLLVTAAGVIANYILAVALIFIVIAAKNVQPTAHIGSVDASLVEGYTGFENLEEGDRIWSVDGVRINTWHEFQSEIKGSDKDSVYIELSRRNFPEPPMGATVPTDIESLTSIGLTPMGHMSEIVVEGVKEGGLLHALGVEAGATINAINGHRTDTLAQVRDVIASSDEILTINVTVDELVVELNTDEITEKHTLLGATVRSNNLDRSGDYFVRGELKPVETLKLAVLVSNHTVKAMIDGLKKLVSGESSASEISGPIGIATVTGEAAREGLLTFISLAALISLNLAIFNALPVPPLDGAMFIKTAIEMVVRRDIPEKLMSAVGTVGLLMLFGLFLFTSFMDVSRLFS